MSTIFDWVAVHPGSPPGVKLRQQLLSKSANPCGEIPLIPDVKLKDDLCEDLVTADLGDIPEAAQRVIRALANRVDMLQMNTVELIADNERIRKELAQEQLRVRKKELEQLHVTNKFAKSFSDTTQKIETLAAALDWLKGLPAGYRTERPADYGNKFLRVRKIVKPPEVE